MKLLPNEEKIINFKNEVITLTNLRINLTHVKWGQTYSNYIFLEDISSVETKFTSTPILLILSAISLLAGIVFNGSFLLFGSILCVVLIIAWLVTRKFMLLISSNGGTSISFEAHNIDDEAIESFIHEISKAKQNRIIQIQKL